MVITLEGLTLEQFLELPEQEPPLEYEPDGRITQKVSPKGRHSRLQIQFAQWLNLRIEPGRLATALTELRGTFAGASYVPDIAVYRWERVPLTPDGEIADDFFVPPDVAIEILSPRPSRRSQLTRCGWYVANGVCLALLIDPERREVHVYRPAVAPEVLVGDARIDLSVLAPDLGISVADIFGALRFA
jgi:Uma2 family endonuclease